MNQRGSGGRSIAKEENDVRRVITVIHPPKQIPGRHAMIMMPTIKATLSRNFAFISYYSLVAAPRIYITRPPRLRCTYTAAIKLFGARRRPDPLQF